ncbi:killer cell lectin-like receptor subfamily B member 1, partial [Lacerta agilis]|uniref:killer cell lectin-like receptor subfamily B member 1 n=1 Tax=Lacerta agilis TaxID=80427 RepID=UPI00141A4257
LFIAAPQHSRWIQIALWASCIGNVILVIAVIVLALQLEAEKGKIVLNNGGCNASIDKFRASLRHRICNQNQNRSSDNSTCKVCPKQWQLHRNKCYWTSENFKTWDESKRDCSTRDSQLLVIQDKEELVRGQLHISGNAFPCRLILKDALVQLSLTLA